MGVKGIRGIGVPKSFKEFVMTLLASTPVFHKKKKTNVIFVIFDVLFVDARNILDNYRSRGLFFNKRPYLNSSFCC